MKKKIQVIAEIGVNHNGDIKKAFKLIDAAKECGANFVKFQLFNTESLVIRNAKKAKYQRKYDESKNQFTMLKKLELSNNSVVKIIQYCKKKKINFLATPFDLKNVNFLRSIKQNYIKISSADINNYPLLEKIGQNKKKFFYQVECLLLKIFLKQ